MADITVYSAPDGAGQVAVSIEEIEQLLGRHLHPRERNLIKPFLNRNGFLIGDRAAVLNIILTMRFAARISSVYWQEHDKHEALEDVDSDTLKMYGYYDLRVEWWYWCERQRGAIYNWIEDRAPNLAFALDKRVPTFYVRRKDAERAARERVRGV